MSFYTPVSLQANYKILLFTNDNLVYWHLPVTRYLHNGQDWHPSLCIIITTATKVNLSKLFNHHHLLPIKLNNQHNHNQRLQKSEKLLLRCRRRKIHIMHKASREKHTRGFCRHKETESKSNNETQTESKSETQSESADSGFSTTRVRVRKGSRD